MSCNNCGQCQQCGYSLGSGQPPCNNPCTSTPACPEPIEPNYTDEGCYPLIKTDCIINTAGEFPCLNLDETSTGSEIIVALIEHIDSFPERIETSPGLKLEEDNSTEENCRQFNLSIKLSEDEDNIIEEREDGLYATALDSVPITPVETDSIVITATGTNEHTISATLKLDTTSNDGDNIAEITEYGVYVPPTNVDPAEVTPEIICAALTELYGDADNDEQKNDQDPETYSFLSLDNDGEGCQTNNISAPTGFAVSGPNRVSAFGKMKWFSNLTAANAAAVSGDTITLYSNTNETLLLKNGVNYEGFGVRTIGTMTGVNYSGRISNISTTLTDPSNTVIIFSGTGEVHLTNVEIKSTNANITISNSMQVIGGSWKITDGTKRLTIQNGASLSRTTLIDAIVNVYNSASFLFNEVKDTRAYLGSGVGAVNINNGTPFAKPKVAFNSVYSADNIGIASIYSADVSHNSVNTVNRAAIYIHGGSDVGISGNPTFINVTHNQGFSKESSGLTVVSSQINGGYTLNSLIHWNVAFNSGVSEKAPGIMSIEGNLRACTGYSYSGSAGIFIGGSDYPSSVTQVIDCIGEAKAGAGLIATRNIFISGGMYISRLNSSAGAAIKIADNSNYRQNGSIPSDEYFHIVNVTTKVRHESAYGIAHLNSSEPGSYPGVPIKVKIYKHVPLCDTVEHPVLGIDPNANLVLVATTLDAYVNHT